MPVIASIEAPPVGTTLVRIEVDDAAGRLQATRWTPVGRLATAERVVVNTRLDIAPSAEDVAAGFYTFALMATDDPDWLAPWCWRVSEPGGRTRHVLVPSSDEPLSYSQLVEVDPATFDPVPDPAHGLWLGFRDLARRVAQIEAGHPVSDPIGTTDADLDAYVAGFLDGTFGATL